MVEKKIIGVIEARMGSKRFPGKSLKKLDKKNNLIDYVIKNLLKSEYFENKNIYILTSEAKNNKSLISYIKKNYKINIIIGPEENVFGRYLKLKNKKNFLILRLTGDNPLVDPLLIDKFIETFLKKKIHYLSTRSMVHSENWKVKSSFPKGVSLEAFYSKKLFEKERYFKRDIFQFPTWFFFNKKIIAKIRKFNSFGNYKFLKKNFSFTIDQKRDYYRVKNFIKKNRCIPGTNNLWNTYSRKKI
tara:strand:- start:519 stop:1250 length:732 start_codon:yes stop_codon:yes gene_type:complete